jgi:hypothetical protein
LRIVNCLGMVLGLARPDDESDHESVG